MFITSTSNLKALADQRINRSGTAPKIRIVRGERLSFRERAIPIPAKTRSFKVTLGDLSLLQKNRGHGTDCLTFSRNICTKFATTAAKKINEFVKRV